MMAKLNGVPISGVRPASNLNTTLLDHSMREESNVGARDVIVVGPPGMNRQYLLSQATAH